MPRYTLDFDAEDILQHKVEDGVTRYLVKWSDSDVPLIYLQKYYPLLLSIYERQLPSHADEEAVLRELPNGRLLCRWAPSWTSDVSEPLLAKYMRRTQTPERDVRGKKIKPGTTAPEEIAEDTKEREAEEKETEVEKESEEKNKMEDEETEDGEKETKEEKEIDQEEIEQKTKAKQKQTEENQTKKKQTKKKQTKKQTEEKQTEEKQTEEKQTEEKQTEEKQTEETEEKQTEEKQTEEKQTEEKQTEEKQTEEKQTEEKQTEEKQTEEKRQTDKVEKAEVNDDNAESLQKEGISNPKASSTTKGKRSNTNAAYDLAQPFFHLIGREEWESEQVSEVYQAWRRCHKNRKISSGDLAKPMEDWLIDMRKLQQEVDRETVEKQKTEVSEEKIGRTSEEVNETIEIVDQKTNKKSNRKTGLAVHGKRKAPVTTKGSDETNKKAKPAAVPTEKTLTDSTSTDVDMKATKKPNPAPRAKRALLVVSSPNDDGDSEATSEEGDSDDEDGSDEEENNPFEDDWDERKAKQGLCVVCEDDKKKRVYRNVCEDCHLRGVAGMAAWHARVVSGYLR